MNLTFLKMGLNRSSSEKTTGFAVVKMSSLTMHLTVRTIVTTELWFLRYLGCRISALKCYSDESFYFPLSVPLILCALHVG